MQKDVNTPLQKRYEKELKKAKKQLTKMERPSQPISIIQPTEHTADSVGATDGVHETISDRWTMVTKARKGRSNTTRKALDLITQSQKTKR